MGIIEEKKEVTLDDLAVMVAKGFEDISNRMATKADIAEPKLEIEGLRNYVVYSKIHITTDKPELSHVICKKCIALVRRYC